MSSKVSKPSSVAQKGESFWAYLRFYSVARSATWIERTVILVFESGY